ncbi:MAG: SAF domain-containing protein [Solirubrobacterales bacterium]
MLFWYGTLVAILAAAALYVGLVVRGRTTVVVPVHDIAAFSRIEADDLSADSVLAQGSDGSDFDSVADVEGRLARRDLGAGDAIAADDVTPPLGPDLGPVHLQLQAEPASALGLDPGDRVDLMLTPVQPGLEATKVGAVLLAAPAAQDGKGAESYVVALTPDAARRLLDGLGRSKLLIAAAG